MSQRFDYQNSTPALFVGAVYQLINQIVLAGGVIKGSGDGASGYSSTDGTAITNGTGSSGSGGGSTAGFFDNAKAWIRVRLGDGAHEFTFQRNSSTGANTSRSWRIKYSKGAGFTGGSPGANQTPTATDEHVLMGGGTDASPTFTQWMSESDGTYYQNTFADSAAPYGFYAFYVVIGLGYTALGGNMIFEPLTVTTPTTDPDPYVVYWSQNSDTAGSNLTYSTSSSGTYWNQDGGSPAHCAGYLGASFTNAIPACAITHTGGGTSHVTCYPNSGTAFGAGDPNATSDDVTIQIPFQRNTQMASPNGWKGFSTNTLLIIFQAAARSQLAFHSVSTTGDHVLLGPNGTASVATIAVPWNNAAISG